MTYTEFKILEINWIGDISSPYQFTVKVELISPDSPRTKHVTLSMDDFPDERTIKETVGNYIELEKQNAINQIRMRSLLGKVIEL